MASLGAIGMFRSNLEDWQSYVKRLQQFFVTNDIRGEEEQHAILLSTVGATTYQLIRNILAPVKPNDTSFTDIVDAVQQHRQPKPSVIVQHFMFHSRVRNSGEIVSAYVTELRKLSKGYKFSEVESDMLRDQLVCGINDQALQRWLLAEPDLTFKTALDVTQASEAADCQVKELGKQAHGKEVHSMSSRDRPQKRGGTQRKPGGMRSFIFQMWRQACCRHMQLQRLQMSPLWQGWVHSKSMPQQATRNSTEPLGQPTTCTSTDSPDPRGAHS